FFQSLEAIRDKRGTDHQEFFDAASRELRQFVIRKGLQPGMAAQAGLKGEGMFIRGHAGPFDKRSHRLETLGAITGGMRRTRYFATSLSRQAMASGRIRFSDLALWDAMKTEEQVIKTAAQIGLGNGDHCVNIVTV